MEISCRKVTRTSSSFPCEEELCYPKSLASTRKTRGAFLWKEFYFPFYSLIATQWIERWTQGFDSLLKLIILGSFVSLKLCRNFSCCPVGGQGVVLRCSLDLQGPQDRTFLPRGPWGCGCHSWKEPAGFLGGLGSFRPFRSAVQSAAMARTLWEPEGLEMPLACCSRDPGWFLNVDLSKSVTIPRAITTKFKK